jgi:hypothetical protein
MKIMILSIARTGSSYLTNLLKSYSLTSTISIVEPFNHEIKLMAKQDKYILRTIQNLKEQQNIILKTHLNQVYNIKKEKYRNYILNDTSWFRILLLRKDLFACSFSHAVADVLNNFNDKKYESNIELTIDTTAFLKILNTKLFCWNKFSEIKSAGNYNQIIYFEDLSFSSTIDIQKINVFLFNNKPRSITYKNKTPYENILINNTEELQNLFFEFIKKFSFVGVSNNNGFLELK